MEYRSLFLLAIVAFAGNPARASTIVLGTAGDFAVLGGSTVTNTGPTIINGGNVGVSPGTSITGFPTPGTITAPYSLFPGGPVAAQAHSDLITAYNAAAAVAFTQDLTGQDLGGLTLTPGVYFFSATAQLTGTLTLNDMGDPNAEFIFQIGSTLTTAVDSAVVSINGGSMPGSNVFWQVGSSAMLDTGSAFEGHILADASITLGTGASIEYGSALAITAAVTLDDNNITNAVYTNSSSVIPEPATITLAVVAGAMFVMIGLRKWSVKRGPWTVDC